METKTPVSAILDHKGPSVHNIQPDASVLDAVHLMNEKKVGSLLVIENGKSIGIFTERDVLVRIVDARRDPAATTVRDVMTANPIVIKPSVTIEEAMRIVTEKRRRHLPVINEDGELLGLISIGDLMRWIVREQDTYVDHLLDYIHGRYPG